MISECELNTILKREKTELINHIHTTYWNDLFKALFKKHTYQFGYFLVPVNLNVQDVTEYFRKFLSELSFKYLITVSETIAPKRTEFKIKISYYQKKKSQVDELLIVICTKDITLRIFSYAPLLKQFMLEEYILVGNLLSELFDDVFNRLKDNFDELVSITKRIEDCSKNVTSKSIEIAKKYYSACEFYIANMLELPFQDNEFDFVYSSLAITHVEDKDKLFKEIYRVLDKNGELLFSVGHPMRFANRKVKINNDLYNVIGFESGSDGKGIIGNYMSYTKQINVFPNNEVLEEFIAPPSYYFEKLLNNGFMVENFKESRCIEECKEIDELYYNRFQEIPQFMGFLAKKLILNNK